MLPLYKKQRTAPKGTVRFVCGVEQDLCVLVRQMR